MRHPALALLAGGLFGAGLVLGGMTQPAKVVAFLDVLGGWDPSLAFVMLGAVAVYLPAYRIITRRHTPMFAARFLVPERRDVEPRLLVGGAVFGVGWGLAGFCPGPALTAVGALVPEALIVAASMAAGMLLHHVAFGPRARAPVPGRSGSS